MPLIQDRFISGIRPDIITEASVLLPYLLITPGVADHSLDLSWRTDHAFRIQDSFHIGIGIFGNLIKIEVVKTKTEDFTLLQHQIPAQATLQTLKCQVLEHVPVVMYRDPPFGIMVYSVGFIHPCPGTVPHHILSSRYRTRFPVFSAYSISAFVLDPI